jgi:recombination protein RecT
MAEEQKNTQLAEKDVPMSVRFMNKVIAEFGSSVGEIALTNFQKRLAQNYFIVADTALRAAEERRLRKPEQYRDKVPVTWANVDLENLARSVVSAARTGWDPLQDNHVSLVPFKDNNTGKYLINLMPGYRGIELKAVKYGLDVPDYVVVELVHKNDHFKEVKKDRNNPYATYEFEVVNSFDRGEIVGGFYYHGWKDEPEKNKLVVFTLDDILKRKPEYAAPEFWGGEKDEYKNGKKTGRKIKVEGWFEKMCWKTIYRAAYRDITIDSQKIDDDYLHLKQMEESFAEQGLAEEIEANANKDVIDVEYSVVEYSVADNDAEIEQPEDSDSPPKPEKEVVGATSSSSQHSGQQTIGPDF